MIYAEYGRYTLILSHSIARDGGQGVPPAYLHFLKSESFSGRGHVFNSGTKGIFQGVEHLHNHFIFSAYKESYI